MTSQNALYKVFLVLLGSLVVFLFLSRCSLSKELQEANANLDRKKAEITALELSISKQNAAIDDLTKKVSEAKSRYERAIEVTKRKNQELDKIIRSFDSVEGKGCDDAMPMVNEVIGLPQV